MLLAPQILRNTLAVIDGRDYGRYQSLIGRYDFNLFTLGIQQIPKDPYAPPHTGVYCIQVQRKDQRIIDPEPQSAIQTIAFSDFLARLFFQASQHLSKGIRGTGFSGMITITPPGQAILTRSSVVVTDEIIELRCFIGLPADGRKIQSQIAEQMLFRELPDIVRASLLSENVDHQALARHMAVAEDAEYLRASLDAHGLVGFIAENAILPRQSGTSDKPLGDSSVIPFMPPKSLTLEIKLPHTGVIKGLGIPEGVTLITGGGYHGKSTLLHALETGIYNHVPGDGRELCVSNPQTVKIRAYSGRSVVRTDISPFIRNLPFQKDTRAFSTDNASGSTSQAAGIIEAIEVGARVLLMDEDTCASNFMIRDRKMQELVDKDDEPITTFIDKVKQLHQEKHISTILVLGGAGDYFDVADHVIQMLNYQPSDVTAQAHQIACRFPQKRWVEDQAYPFHITERMPLADNIDPHNAYGKIRIHAKDLHYLVFGLQTIDLTDLEQLMELSQTKAIGQAIEYGKKYMDGQTPLRDVVRYVARDIAEQGLDVLTNRVSGQFAWFREFELAFALNRFSGLNVIPKAIGDK